jgi:hypothetical protein
MASNASNGSTGGYGLQLFFVWFIVAIPLLWGIGVTWVNVQKLFAAPPAVTEPATPATK